MNKNKMFKSLSYIQILANLLGGTVGILFALNGGGIYSLIFSVIASSFCTLLLALNKSKIKLVFKLKMATLFEILKFSSNQFGFNFINYFARNSDNLLVGKFMGSTALGNYSKAYQLLMMPNTVLLAIITPVLQPVLSDYQDDVLYIRNTYYEIVKILALIGLPLSIFLCLTSKEIIFILFGNQWGQAVMPFAILSLTVWVQMTLSSSGTIYQSRNLSNQLLINGVISSAILITSIAIGVFLGNLISLSICLSIGFIINFFVTFYRLTKFALNDSIFPLLRQFIHPFLIAILIFISLMFTDIILRDKLGILISFIIKGTIFVIEIIGFSYLFGDLNGIRKLLTSKR
jgi:O-antigen/teichoic acid export membrane protein